MCQSKADGGRRCEFHLEQGVDTGIAAYCCAVTGLTRKEAIEAQSALQREGAAAPAPSREEVDDFLERQIFRVRHDPDLTEKKRESIINRLRAAVGRISPTGARFHAWKNLVAESWARVRRRAAAAFVVGALSFSVVGCGNAPETSSMEPAQANNVAATTYDTSWEDGGSKINPAAVRKFGKAKVNAAVEQAQTLLRDYSYNDDLILNDVSSNKAHLLQISDQLGPNARKDWESHVKKLAADRTNGDAQNLVYTLALTDVYPTNHPFEHNGISLQAQAPASGPASTNPVMHDSKVRVDDEGRLEVVTRVETDLRVTHDGNPMLWHFDRTNTFWMIDTSDGWKIDGWQGAYAASPTLKVEK